MSRTRFLYALVIAGSVVAAHAEAQEAPVLDSEKAKLSYAMGADIGKGLKAFAVEVSPDLVLQGMNDVLTGKPSLMSDEDVKLAMEKLRQDVRQRQVAAAQALADENKRKGDEFLAANKKADGVITLASGLQYKILEPGDGSKPTSTDQVTVHYRGTFIDGTEFDSSYARNKPASFPVNRVIKGWREALQLMPVGSKWQLFVPSDLAYGPRGTDAKIGPNATLVFEVKLLGIEDKGAGAQVSKNETATEAERPATMVAQNETSAGTANDATTEQQPAVDVTDIKVSFKLDPRLMGGTYAQPGWVAPPVYEGIQGQNIIVAKADGFDEKGQLIEGIEPQWIPEDPDMVSVSPGEGGSVKITINGPTESGLKLVYGEFSKTLSVTATTDNDILQIKISQL